MGFDQFCPECKAGWTGGQTCQDYFHQMLFWEAEYPACAAEVHHLMVLCYHLQHPGLYSPQGLREARRLLAEFLVEGLSPQEARDRQRSRVDSGKRKWKIRGTPASQGAYDPPVHWTITAGDVVAGGVERYCDNVREWARGIYEVIKEIRE